MSEPRVTISITDHVADVKLNRADKHNGLDKQMFFDLRQAAKDLRSNPDVRAVVLSGDGPSFSAGLDIMSFIATGEMKLSTLGEIEAGEISNLAQSVAYYWRKVEAPVIAALHGNCFGGGMQIALGADIRIAAPSARLSIMEIKWGLIPDMALMTVAPGVLRQDVVKELTFTGRIVGGEEAVTLGLATQVADDPHAAAMDLAKTIASKSPDAIRADKRLLNAVWNMSDQDRLALEAETQDNLIGSRNQLVAAAKAMGAPDQNYVDPQWPPQRDKILLLAQNAYSKLSPVLSPVITRGLALNERRVRRKRQRQPQ